MRAPFFSFNTALVNPTAMPFSYHPHPLQRYWDIASAAVQADALAAALELGVPDALRDYATAHDTARRLGLQPAATAPLLDLLWSIDVLDRTEADGDMPHRYRVSEGARRYLLADSAAFCADALLFRLRSLRGAGGRLGRQLRPEQGQDVPRAPTGSDLDWAQAARVQIGQEQRAVSVDAALHVMARVPEAAQTRRWLDLGGGPGWIGIALAKLWPDSQGVVFDGPATAAVAGENIAREQLSHRVRAVGGDIGGDIGGDAGGRTGDGAGGDAGGDRTRDSIGEGHDLVWCSSVLHFVPDVDAMLRRVLAALRPGGLFVCAHAEVGASREQAAAVLPFYLPMMVLGRHVGAAGSGEAALERAGFQCLRRFASPEFPMAPLQVLVARRPNA